MQVMSYDVFSVIISYFILVCFATSELLLAKNRVCVVGSSDF